MTNTEWTQTIIKCVIDATVTKFLHLEEENPDLDITNEEVLQSMRDTFGKLSSEKATLTEQMLEKMAACVVAQAELHRLFRT